MSAQANAVSNLSVLLERHAAEIATSWTDLVHQLPEDSVDMATRPRTLELTKGSLLAIAVALRTGSCTDLEQHLSNSNRQNMQSGASIDTVVETLLMLTDAALPVILRTFPAGSDAMASAISQLDASLRWLTGYLARLHNREEGRHHRDRYLHADHVKRAEREQRPGVQQVPEPESAPGVARCADEPRELAPGDLLRVARTGDVDQVAAVEAGKVVLKRYHDQANARVGPYETLGDDPDRRPALADIGDGQNLADHGKDVQRRCGDDQVIGRLDNLLQVCPGSQ